MLQVQLKEKRSFNKCLGIPLGSPLSLTGAATDGGDVGRRRLMRQIAVGRGGDVRAVTTDKTATVPAES